MDVIANACVGMQTIAFITYNNEVNIMIAPAALMIHLILYLFLNTYRFALTHKGNEILYLFNALLLTGGLSFWIGSESLIWTGLMIPFAFTSVYRWRGAFIGLIMIFAIFIIFELHTVTDPFLLFGGYALYTLSLSVLFHYLMVKSGARRSKKRFFYKQSKNLHVLREISLALQSTLQKNKLMHIFLTAVTAGYGLGFNRAMIFLKKDVYQETFVGNAAIGPLSIQEGHQIWENVVSQRLTLRDFIKLQKEAEENDQELNRKVRDLEFTITDHYPVLKHVIENKDPLLVSTAEWYSHCKMVQKLNDHFDVTKMAVIPLMTRGRAIGVMVIDNIVDGKPFSYEDLDNIMPLATQGAMAIENALLYERTQELVMTDGLTRLRNKRYLETITQDLYTEAKRHHTALAVMMIDLDYFKVYNDTNGHLMGDQVLVQVASLLSNLTPDTGAAIRFGGEEFCVILPGCSQEDAQILAENIRQSINEYPFKSRERQPDGALSASIGLSVYPDNVDEPESLIETADQAVYASKKNGRNRVTVFMSDPKGERS